MNSPGAINTAVGGDMLLGAFWNGSTPAAFFFNGLVDEAQIYNVVLTDQEIAQLAQ